MMTSSRPRETIGKPSQSEHERGCLLRSRTTGARPGGGRRRRALSASPPQLTLRSVGRRLDWVRGVGEGRFWLVEADPSAGRQGELGDADPARLVAWGPALESAPEQVA